MHYCDSKATCYTVDSVSTLQEPYLILKYWNLEFPRARMSQTWDKKEYESPPVIEPVGCSNHWATKGELGHIQGSCMTCVLRTARISNVEIVICMINKISCDAEITTENVAKSWRALYQPMYGNPRQSWILDSRPWISDSRYWIPTEYFVNGTCRFRIRIVSRIPDSLSCIPYSKAQDSEFRSKNFPDSGFHKQNYSDSGFKNFPGFRIPKQKFVGIRIPQAKISQILDYGLRIPSDWATFNSQIRNLHIYLYMFSTMTSMILNVP